MKQIGILALCAVFAMSGASVAFARHKGTGNVVEPQGAERAKQFAWATKECQKRFGGAYANHVQAQWSSDYGHRGWFCVFNR
jgi:hypothetical protein